MSSLRALSASTTFAVPSTDGPSSSDVMRSETEPEWFGLSFTNASTATTNAAIEDFMSAAPRPKSLPSRIVGTNGSECHSESGPVGTTSVWPAKQITGCVPPRRAQRLSTSPKRIGSQRKPSGFRRSARTCWQPQSCGVTELRPMSSFASSSADSSGIHIELEAAEGIVGLRHALRDRLAGDLPGGRLVDEPEHVGRRVGVGEGLFLRDLAVHEELEERLLEGLRSRRHAFLERLLDLAD